MSSRKADTAIGPPPASAKRAKIAAAPIASCANAKSAKADRIEALVPLGPPPIRLDIARPEA
jgi:hypothetical protein